jgi:alpha-ketoglutarate-dependent taurine dioxygenase
MQTSSPTATGLDAVNISFLKTSGKNHDKADSSKKMPLVISPRWDSSLNFLIFWCQENRSWLDRALLDYGAILIRGFDVNTAADMEQAVKAYQLALNDTYRGTSPRKRMENTDFIFSAAEVPTNYPIGQHLEMSFLEAPPAQLYFGCLQPSRAVGGETSLADFSKVYQDLSLELKQKFLDKGIRYTRTHKKKGTYFTYDVADMLGWPELFGTSDKTEVEKMCAAEGIPVTWTDDDTFVSVSLSNAFQLHPTTGVPVWFNHTQVFHWTTFPAELFFAWQRCNDWRLLAHCILVTIFCVIKYGLLGHKMSLHCSFGDGSPISISEMNEIRGCIHKNMVFSRWEKGDMLFLDNFCVSHGRQPTYDKNRKIVVAWADPIPKTNAVISISTDENATICKENPQERTPKVSLTKEETERLEHEIKTKLALHSQKRLPQNPQDLELTEDTLNVLKNIVAKAEASRHIYHHAKSFSLSSVDVGSTNFWQEDD